VSAKTLIGPTARFGGSRSRYVRCSDGAIYNVKFRESDQGVRMPINELVASQIAIAMGVPTPEIAVVDIDATFLEANPKLRTTFDSPIQPGPQFGSKYIQPCFGVPEPFLVSLASNRQDFNRIVVFDVATNNSDRCENNYDNVLLVRDDPESPDSFRLLSIDHGACFGDWWDDSLHLNAGEWSRSVMRELLALSCADSLFFEALHAAKIITNDLADTVVSDIPQCWALSTEERLSLSSYLSNQASQITRILVKNSDAFPNWCGI
jgi:hypothetical protein